MKFRRFDPLNCDLSRLVLGTMVFNTNEEGMKTTFDLMNEWLNLGGNIVDCANVYGGGNSERALGRWIEETGRREEIVILTKGAHMNGDRRRVTPWDIGSDLLDSLARLKTDYVDLYLLHRDDPSVPVGPIVEALNEHKRAGRIRAFGGSNWSVERLEEANTYADAHGLEPFTASSPNLSLATQNEPMWFECNSANDPDSLAWYERTQMPLFAWSSQAGGFFTGRFSPENRDNSDMVRVYYNDGNWERLKRAQELGERKAVPALQIALAWVLNQPFPAYALFGPRNLEELHSSIAAIEVELTPDEVQWLNLSDGAAS